MLAWSSAETGAAATIAPSSQGWNGMSADLTAAATMKPARIRGIKVAEPYSPDRSPEIVAPGPAAITAADRAIPPPML